MTPGVMPHDDSSILPRHNRKLVQTLDDNGQPVANWSAADRGAWLEQTPMMRQRLQATATARSPCRAQKTQAGHQQLRKGQRARDNGQCVGTRVRLFRQCAFVI